MNLLAEKLRAFLTVIGVIVFASQHGFAERPINATSNLQELTRQVPIFLKPIGTEGRLDWQDLL
jgi:hypothetical protein